MKPLPTEPSKESPRSLPVLPLNSHPGSFSTANRRAAACPIQRLYPWLLFASTAVAATFCPAYITKPVLISSPPPTAAASQEKSLPASNSIAGPEGELSIVPNETSLPGEAGGPPLNPAASSPLATKFEETNIRIQHVLDAESPSGDISRIVIDVPVLYPSRNLRWTQDEAAEARALLEQLALYQENVRELRSQGIALRTAWNELIQSTIPTEVLRADSPTLPANQQDGLSSAPLSESAETIKLRTNPRK